jgi:hypothetical protein
MTYKRKSATFGFLSLLIGILALLGCSSTKTTSSSPDIRTALVSVLSFDDPGVASRRNIDDSLAWIRLLVVDHNDRPITGAGVQIEGTKLGGMTDADGVASIIRVSPGVYDVSVKLFGYEVVILKGVPAIYRHVTMVEKVGLKRSHVEFKWSPAYHGRP